MLYKYFTHAVDSEFERSTENLALPKKSPKKGKSTVNMSSGTQIVQCLYCYTIIIDPISSSSDDEGI